jgi:hypothetical protein
LTHWIGLRLGTHGNRHSTRIASTIDAVNGRPIALHCQPGDDGNARHVIRDSAVSLLQEPATGQASLSGFEQAIGIQVFARKPIAGSPANRMENH